MPSLEQVLKENYNQIVDYNVIPKVMDYISSHESISSSNPVFAKRLLKAANLILQENNNFFLASQLEKLYYFSNEAINMVCAQENFLKAPTRGITMIGHIYVHQGHFAWELYWKTNKKPSWLRKSHQSFKKANHVLSSIDSPKNNEYLAWIYYHAGHVVLLRAHREQSVKLARKAERLFKKCQDYQKKSNIESLRFVMPTVQRKIQLLHLYNTNNP